MTDRSQFGQAVTLGSSDLPEMVHHYTSTSGLLGILRSRRMWATDVRYLNDTSELEYGLGQLLLAFETMAQAGPRGFSFLDRLASLYDFEAWAEIGRAAVMALNDMHRESIEYAVRQILHRFQSAATIGVTCFCADGDLLSQWRGYGANGYAIGFDAPKLGAAANDRYLRLSRVVYGRPASRPTFRSLSAVADQLLAAGNVGARLQQEVTVPLLGLAAQVKNPAFKSENEYRVGDIATSQSDDLKYRDGGLGVTPYIDLLVAGDDGLPPIKEIRVSPGPETVLREAAVRALLRSCGFATHGAGAVRVVASNIPFRG